MAVALPKPAWQISIKNAGMNMLAYIKPNCLMEGRISFCSAIECVEVGLACGPIRVEFSRIDDTIGSGSPSLTLSHHELLTLFLCERL